MHQPTCQKDMQKITRCMAALSRFISSLGLPFLKLLKKRDNFEWDQEAKKAFEDLKAYLMSPPVLIAPNEG